MESPEQPAPDAAEGGAPAVPEEADPLAEDDGGAPADAQADAASNASQGEAASHSAASSASRDARHETSSSLVHSSLSAAHEAHASGDPGVEQPPEELDEEQASNASHNEAASHSAASSASRDARMETSHGTVGNALEKAHAAASSVPPADEGDLFYPEIRSSSSCDGGDENLPEEVGLPETPSEAEENEATQLIRSKGEFSQEEDREEEEEEEVLSLREEVEVSLREETQLIRSKLGRERAGLSASDRFQTPVSDQCHAGCTVHVTV